MKKAYGDNLLFEDMTFNLPKGGIVGIIGPNGAGKTTLFQMIVGQETPDGGKLTVGPTVKAAHVDQNRDALVDSNNTIFEEITGGTDYIMLGKQKVASRGYCARFNFKGPDQQKKVGDCSGGERNRIHLAKLLRSGGNLLLLDEPTNDLDVDTLRALEDALVNFAGCAVVISHDRWFLDRIATHILAFEGDSKVVWCEGNFRVYEEQKQRTPRRRRRPAAPDQVPETPRVVRGYVAMGRAIPHEVRVHGYRDRRTAVLAPGWAGCEEWLQSSLLRVALLDQPFVCVFRSRTAAMVFARRVRAGGSG